MARILLIHGAAHGAWCWHKVLPSLTDLGHEAKAIDLPSHGDNLTPLSAVTLDSYADAILSAMDGPTLVVGHSMGGYPISLAASVKPEQFVGLIYLCAYIPRFGLSLSQMRKLAKEQPLLPAIRRNPDGISMHFDPKMADSVFYHDCPGGTLDYALPRLCDQALLPMETPFAPGPGSNDVPKSAILCRDDAAIPYAWQKEMAADLPPEAVQVMNTSHSPFFSDPSGLANRIDQIARLSA